MIIIIPRSLIQILQILVIFVTKQSHGEAPKIDTPMEFVNAAVTLVNELRDIHQVGPVTLNLSLCQEAEIWAKKVGRQDEKVGVPHAYYSRKKEVTENVWASEDYQDVNASMPIMDWYHQVSAHNWSNNIYTYPTAQFSALVWKASDQFGIAKVITPNKHYIIVVARLIPPGNWNYYKDFAENVFPARTTTTPPGEGPDGNTTPVVDQVSSTIEPGSTGIGMNGTLLLNGAKWSFQDRHGK